MKNTQRIIEQNTIQEATRILLEAKENTNIPKLAKVDPNSKEGKEYIKLLKQAAWTQKEIDQALKRYPAWDYKKPEVTKTASAKIMSSAEYQKLLKGAVKDAGGADHAHDMAQSMIMNTDIQARIKKDYGDHLSLQKMTQRLQWDLEAYD